MSMTEQGACSLTAWERIRVHATTDSNNNTEITFIEHIVDVTQTLFRGRAAPEVEIIPAGEA